VGLLKTLKVSTDHRGERTWPPASPRSARPRTGAGRCRATKVKRVGRTPSMPGDDPRRPTESSTVTSKAASPQPCRTGQRNQGPACRDPRHPDGAPQLVARDVHEAAKQFCRAVIVARIYGFVGQRGGTHFLYEASHAARSRCASARLRLRDHTDRIGTQRAWTLDGMRWL